MWGLKIIEFQYERSWLRAGRYNILRLNFRIFGHAYEKQSLGGYAPGKQHIDNPRMADAAGGKDITGIPKGQRIGGELQDYGDNT